MYKTFFKLRENPFNVNVDPRFFIPTQQTGQALQRITYGIQNRRGLILLTGEVGTGKTMLINQLLDWLRQMGTPTAFVFNSKLGEGDLFNLMACDFGIALEPDERANLPIRLNRWLLDCFHAGVSPVLIVDEAQGLSFERLEEIRLLLNIETPSDKMLQIVFAGQPELEDNLNQPQGRQIRQRIAVRCKIGSLSAEQTHTYIEHRLRVAGATGEPIFLRDAMDAVYFYSRGIPRVINLICEHSLINAYVDQLRQIPARVVEQVAAEFQLTSIPATADATTAQSNFGWLPPQRAAGREPAEAQRAHAAVAGGSSQFPKASPRTQPATAFVVDHQSLAPARSASDPLSIFEASTVINASPDTRPVPAFADFQSRSAAPSISDPLSIFEASPVPNVPFNPADVSEPAEQPRHWPGIWPAPPRESAPAPASSVSAQHFSSPAVAAPPTPFAPAKVSREAYRVAAGNGSREGNRSREAYRSEERHHSEENVRNAENFRRQRHWVSASPRPSQKFNRWWAARRDEFLSAISAAIHSLRTLPILRWLTTSRPAHQHPATERLATQPRVTERAAIQPQARQRAVNEHHARDPRATDWSSTPRPAIARPEIQPQVTQRRATEPTATDWSSSERPLTARPEFEEQATPRASTERQTVERPSLQRQAVYHKPKPAPLPSHDNRPKPLSGYLSTMFQSIRHQRTALVRWLRQPVSSPHRR